MTTRLALGVGLVIAPAAGLVSVQPALAASPITAIGGTCAGGGSLGWTNAIQTVPAGTSITFSNCQTAQPGPGNHGLSASWTNLCSPTTTDWQSISAQSTACTFANAGVYAFVCTVHGASMAGSITVQGVSPASPPATTPPAPAAAPATHPTPPAAPQAGVGNTTRSVPTPSPPPPSPSPTPSDTLQALASPSSEATPTHGVLGANSGLPATLGGPGPLPFVIGLVVLVAVGIGVVYFLRTRNPANPAP